MNVRHSHAGSLLVGGIRRIDWLLTIAVLVYVGWYDRLAPANETVEALVGALVLLVAAIVVAINASDLWQMYRSR